MVYIWPEKVYFLYLRLKNLAHGGIWTHTVRVGEGATTLRVSAHSKNAYGLYLAGKGVFSDTYTWKSWHLAGFEPTLFGRAKVQPHYTYQRIAKTHMV